MATYEILNDAGAVINTVIADAAFVEAHYPGHYRLVPEVTDYVALNRATAIANLQATDWSELPSVSDASATPHLLNIGDFINYRTAIRAIAVNPPDKAVDWPVMPSQDWSV